MYAPRGAIVRTARLRAEDDGAVVTVSAPVVLVTVGATSESRRTFRRAVVAAGCVAEPVVGDAYAEADGTFNRRTGARQRAESVQPTTFRVVGPVDGVRAVCESPAVRAWEFQLGVRVPVVSGGSGTLSAAGERAVRRMMMGRTEREAVEETERRERLPRDAREALELNEQIERERVLAE